MGTDYFSENEAFITNQPLPSPAGTPYMSRRTSRYGTPSNESGPPPPPNPYPVTEDAANNESISILDPRRFTPTLHANLVSEILNLRRELDSKHKFIDDVEATLHTARTENESLVKQLSTSVKETRTAKRQFQHFEHEMLAALEEIAGERDQMKESNADLKAKLEVADKKTRSQETDSKNVHDMWAKEKDVWAGEKRTLERRVHISEARLKLILEEMAAQEASRELADVESDAEDAMRDTGNGPESDAGSVRSSPQRRPSTQLGRHSRNMINSSYRSIGRNYRMSLMSNEGHSRGNGLSLADELIFDEEEEEELDDDFELEFEDYPEHEIRARKALETRQSMMYPDDKAKRILGLNGHNHPSKDIPTTQEEIEPYNFASETVRSAVAITPRDITLVFPPTKPRYVDSGVQPSPPLSPVLPTMIEASSQTLDQAPAQTKPDNNLTTAEVEANQSRKRVSVPLEQSSPPRSANPALCLMISSSVQTIEQPLSPPATPTVSELPALPPSPALELRNVSASTQTEALQEIETPVASSHNSPPRPISIPSIAIHAPDSGPASPKAALLPPGTKTISTQTTIDLAASMRSYGMQTEPIRIDQRPVKLPPHLLPSAISSKPGTPEPMQERLSPSHAARANSPSPTFGKPGARQDLTALLEKAAESKVENRYPGNNDNGPLSKNNLADFLNRPFRTSSLFAGFEGPSSDEEDDDLDTNEGSSMLSSRNAKNGRPVNPPTPVPEEKQSTLISRPSEESVRSRRSDRGSFENPGRIAKRNSLTRQPSIRRSAMIQSGNAAHMAPSMNSIGSSQSLPKPPFPVPLRSSSRNMIQSKSEGSQSPTPGSGGAHAGRRPYVPRHQRKDSIRKVRSTAVSSKAGRPRSISPSLSAAPSISDTASIPPLPSDIVSASGFAHQRHRRQPSVNTAYTANHSSASSSSQANVVDAIAAAMIGEFMWKYVRKRKPFGTPEMSMEAARTAEEASLATNGVRHRRWVWISPYERAILWSSKQPTSGSALMGKSGRKLTIQSVLDVADTCAPPRNETLFNRSILILTPARALKFTTVSRERHYQWLNALSFLAQTSSPVADLSSMPPPPPPVEDTQSQGALFRRSRVQDSVRLAKGKANPVMQRHAAQNDPMPSLPSLSGFERPSIGSASPPSIPRGPAHGRKRSSTGPGAAPPPILPFRTFSHQHVPSVYSNGSSDMYSSMQPPSVPSSVYNPTTGALSSRTSEARTSEASTSARSHFLDAMGTVRMEAFIDNALGDPTQRAANANKIRMNRRRGSSQWSASTREQPMRGGGVFDDFDSPDPFRGF